jgi:integrase/recombinase XerC
MSRLSPDQIYKTVRKIAQDAGIDRIFSPHRMRHTSVTTYLDISGGDVRSAQALSRHKDGNTLAIYDDHRKNLQGGVSQRLSELLDEAIGD